MECHNEDIREPYQMDVDYVNDDVKMINVFYSDEESMVADQEDLHTLPNPFDSDDSLDDYDFAKYMKRGQSQPSEEDEEEESEGSDIHSSHSYDNDKEATYENAFIITAQLNAFEQGNFCHKVRNTAMRDTSMAMMKMTFIHMWTMEKPCPKMLSLELKENLHC